MTCIIGYIDRKNKKTYMASDSAFTSGNHVSNPKNAIKIWKSKENENILIGASGLMKSIGLARSALKFPTEEELLKDGETFDESYIYKNIISKIKKIYDDNDINYMEDPCYFLVAYKDSLFEIEFNLGVLEHKEDYCSIGSGSQYAYGALDVLVDLETDIRNKIRAALNASLRSATVREPFFMIDNGGN